MKTFKAGDVQEIVIMPEWRPDPDGTISIRLSVQGLAGEQAEQLANALMHTTRETLASWGRLVQESDDRETLQ